MDAGSVLTRLMRDPATVARHCLEERDVKRSALVAISALVFGAAVFGATLGSFRGGVQIVFAALKLPLVLLASLVLCVPALYATGALLGRAWPLRVVVAFTLAAAGRAGLLLFAASPLLWLAFDCGLPYHLSILVTSFAYGLSGVAALGVILRAIGRGRGRALAGAISISIFLAANAQTGWLLRPFLLRPRASSVPFARSLEGSFTDAIYLSGRSALGIYPRHSHPECEGERSPSGGWLAGSRCALAPVRSQAPSYTSRPVAPADGKRR